MDSKQQKIYSKHKGNLSLRDHRLDVEGVIREFQDVENSPSHRKGAFKIDAPFEKALDTILKANPDRKTPKRPQR